jgi:hypothetical protein
MADMKMWREVVIQTRCTLSTACALSFLLLSGSFSFGSTEPALPLSNQGVSIALPPIEETSDQTTEAKAVDRVGLQLTTGVPPEIVPFKQGVHDGSDSAGAFPLWGAFASGLDSVTRNQFLAAGFRPSLEGPGTPEASAPAALVDQLEIWRASEAAIQNDRQFFAPKRKPFLQTADVASAQQLPGLESGSHRGEDLEQGNTEGAPIDIAADAPAFQGYITPNPGQGVDSSLSANSTFGNLGFGASSHELALLQRWVGIGEEANTELANANAPDFSFQLLGDFDAENSDHNAFIESEGGWKNQFGLRSDMDFANGLNFKLTHDFKGQREWDHETVGSFIVSRSDYWEEDKNNDTMLEFGVWGDRLKFTTMQSTSRHTDAKSGNEVSVDHGFIQGFNADVFDADDFGLSVYGSYGFTGDSYSLVGDDDDDDEDDEDDDKNSIAILDSGMEETRYGGEADFEFGLATLSLSHDRSWESEEEDNERSDSSRYGAELELDFDFAELTLSHKQKYKTEESEHDEELDISKKYEAELEFDSLELAFSYKRSREIESRGDDRERWVTDEYAAEVEYELDDLQDMFGDTFGNTFWNLAPDSIEVNYELKLGEGSGDESERKTEVGTKASWDWDGGSTSLGYWW